MRRWLFIILLLFPAIAFAAEPGSVVFEGQSGYEVLSAETGRTVLRLELGEVSLEASSGTEEVKLSLPESFGLKRGEVLASSGEVLPTLTFMLSIPFDSPAPTIRVLSDEKREIPGITLAGPDSEQQNALQRGERFSSGLASYLGEEAGIMRDLRLYSITFSPFDYSSDEGKLTVTTALELEVLHPGSRITREEGLLSEAFVPIYRALVDNPQVFDPISPTRGAYWIIYPDAFAANIVPLADWKKAKGFAVEMIPKSAISTNPTYINVKNYILARFDSCLIKPDYITLMGDVTMPNNYNVPTRTYENPYGFGDIESDNFYTFLHGNDYFPEVLIGRISFDYLSDLETYIDKLFSYERTPYMLDTDWYLRGTMVAGSDGYSFTSPRLTKLWCRETMLRHGFTDVDTFFASNDNQIPPYMINASIDQGVAYVNYRGYGGASYWSPPYYNNDNIMELNNAPMYPIMTSIVCGTGDYNDFTDVCFGETWIRADGRGGVGFIGNSNHDAHTRWTNALDVGIYWGLFEEEVTTLAQAELMGKMTLYRAFPNNRYTGGEVELYFNSYNLLGDPEVNCWTMIPRGLTVTHPDSIPLGQNRVSVQVRNSGGGPVEGAAVCIWKSDEIFQTVFSGATGDAIFEATALTSGPMRLTVTARGFAPVMDTIIYSSNFPAVGYSTHLIDDDAVGESSGDGDGNLNPSETIELSVALTNFGSGLDTAFGVTAALICETEGVTITRGGASYGNIGAGQTASPQAPFLLSLGSGISDGTILSLLLTISDQSGQRGEAIIRPVVRAAGIAIDSVIIIDNDNGRIDPGDFFDIVVYGGNTGSRAITNVTAALRVGGAGFHLVDSAAVMGDCLPGGSFNNNSDRFSAWIDSDVYNGRVLNFTVEFTGISQVTAAAFSKTVGQITFRDPIGPDNYGYYCYDNSDSSSLVQPNYSWIDIDIVNWPRVSINDDELAVISLPFPVKYYGRDFSELTICDNGFVTLGETDFPNFYNGPIPAPQNPQAMVAPFWTDFVQSPMRVYYHHDTVEGKFIIGWRSAFDIDNGYAQTFQIIILDEAAFPTRTDDNEIIFQYYSVNPGSNISVGICSPDRRDGICYVFNDILTPGAAPIINGRVIKFTTGSSYIVGTEELDAPREFSLSQNYPNPFNAQTTIEFSLASGGPARLEVFDIMGRRLSVLLDGELEAGTHRAVWDASGVSSGIYLYRLSSPGNEQLKRMTLIK